VNYHDHLVSASCSYSSFHISNTFYIPSYRQNHSWCLAYVPQAKFIDYLKLVKVLKVYKKASQL